MAKIKCAKCGREWVAGHSPLQPIDFICSECGTPSGEKLPEEKPQGESVCQGCLHENSGKHCSCSRYYTDSYKKREA